jgi:hypothetical protein
MEGEKECKEQPFKEERRKACMSFDAKKCGSKAYYSLFEAWFLGLIIWGS